MTTQLQLGPEKPGEFVRKPSHFRNWITSDGSSGFPAESGRYHLYVAYNCPWAHRTIVTRYLKGLEDAISMDVVYYRRGDKGWRFEPNPEAPGSTVDSLYGFSNIQEVYFCADKDYVGRFVVPVLWDKKLKTIVNNESSEIIRMLALEFNAFCRTEEQRALDLYPEAHRQEIDELNEWIYRDFNNGVYRAGFATQQEAYDAAAKAVFAALDRMEDILSRQRYLTGPQITEADVRLYTTLVRFDLVYVGVFKCNKKCVRDYPNLWPYLRDLYQIPAFTKSTNKYYIEHGYQRGIVAIGPDIDLDLPHGRGSQFSK